MWQSAVRQSRQPLPADPEFWAALSTVSVKLYGVPLAENGEPLGGVVAYLREERAAGLAGAVGTLAHAMAGGAV